MTHDPALHAKGFLDAPRITRVPEGVIVQSRYHISAFDPALFDAAGIVRPDSVAKAIPKRQAEFLAGRAMAQAAQVALDRDPVAIGIGPDKVPVWPGDLRGSISHARGHCACLLSADTHADVGIDIEAPAQGRALDAILKVALNESERDLLASAPDMAIAATVAFSAKETLYKALFPTVRQFFGFMSAEIRSLPEVDQLTLCLTEDLHPKLPSGRSFQVSYKVASDHVLTWLAARP